MSGGSDEASSSPESVCGGGILQVKGESEGEEIISCRSWFCVGQSVGQSHPSCHRQP